MTTNTKINISSEELQEKILNKLAKPEEEKKEGVFITVNKVSVDKIGLTIFYDKTITTMKKDDDTGREKLIDFKSEGKEKCLSMPHPDLSLALNLMRSHLLILSNQREAFDERGVARSPQNIDDDADLLENIKLTGFGSKEDGISLTGLFTHRGKDIPLNPPTEELDDSSEEPYEYSAELKHLATHALNEVELYYLHGKVAPDAQQKIEFPDGNDADLDD